MIILNYVSVNGIPKRYATEGGLIPLSVDEANLTDKTGSVEQGYVKANKVFYITADDRVFSNSETNVAEKINELKKQGYDCFVFEQKLGDNYLVAVINKAQILKDKPTKYSRKTDAEHLEAVNRGDMEAVQRMVDEAAKASGYAIKSYHGTLAKDFTEFKKSFIGSRFSFDEKGFFFIDRKSIAEDYARSEFDSKKKGRVLEVYLKVRNPLLVDSQYAIKEGLGKIFRDNDVIDVWDNYSTFLLEEAETKRADGIVIDDGTSKMTVVFDSEQIKSADPVTYDDNGNVIPLSERFNPAKSDIRYSRKPSSNDVVMSKGEMQKRRANYENEKIYSKKEIAEVFSKIEIFKLLSGSERSEWVNDVWRSFNTFKDPLRLGWTIDIYAQKLVSAIIAKHESDVAALSDKIHRLQEQAESLRDSTKTARLPKIEEELEKLRTRLEKILQKAPTAEELDSTVETYKREFTELITSGGEKSLRTRMAETLENEIEAKNDTKLLKEKLSQTEESLRAEREKSTTSCNELRRRYEVIRRLLKKKDELTEFKNGRYVNSARYKSEIFKRTIESLLNIEYLGNIASGKTRTVVAKFRHWYNTEKGHIFNEAELLGGLYADFIAEYIDIIAEGEGALSVVELEMLEEILEHFFALEKNFQKARINGEMKDAKPYVEDFYAKAEEVKTTKDRTSARVLMKTKYGKMALNPQTIVEYEDGGLFGFHRFMFREIQRAEIDKKHLVIELYQPFSDFAEKNKAYFKNERKRSIEFNGARMSIKTARNLYMTMKDMDFAVAFVLNGYTLYNSDGKLASPRGFCPELKDFAKLATQDEIRAECERIVTEKVAELEKLLCKEDIEFIRLQENFYNGRGRELWIEADKRRYGIARIKENAPYYHPGVRDNISNTIDSNRFMPLDAGKNATSNRYRVENTQQQMFILSDAAVLEQYINERSNDYVVSPVIDAFNTLVYLNLSDNDNRPATLQKLLRSTFTDDRAKSDRENGKKTPFDAFYADLFKKIQKGNYTGTKDWLTAIKSNTIKAILGANPKTLINQFASVIAATSEIEPKYIVKGFSYITKDVDEYSKLAKIRHEENGAFLAQANAEANRGFTRGSIGDIATVPIGLMDRAVIKVLWGACRAKTMAESKAEIDALKESLKAEGKSAEDITKATNEFVNKRSAELLDKVILETQQNALVTTKSRAMYSSNPLYKVATLFTADALAVFTKPLRSIVKQKQLKALLKQREAAGNKSGAEEIRTLMKENRRQMRKDVGALIMTSVFTALVAYAFKWFFHREDEDETLSDAALEIAVDSFGNLIGALPVINIMYNYIHSGYGAEDITVGAINDLAEAAKDAFNFAKDLKNDKLDSREAFRTIKNIVFTGSDVLAIPTRNAYNLVYGVFGFNGNLKYKWDDAAYKQSYGSDLKKAVENEDYDAVGTVLGILTGEAAGDITDEKLSKELHRLCMEKFYVTPKMLGDTITYNGVEYELTNTEKKAFRKIYSNANERTAKLVTLKQYGRASDEAKAKAVNFLYDTYYDIAKANAAGDTQKSKDALFVEAIDAEWLALAVGYASVLESDKDRNGKSITGSRKAKIEKMVESLGLTAAQKHMIMGYLGYTNKNGEAQVKTYINRLNLTKEEKAELLEYSGYKK